MELKHTPGPWKAHHAEEAIHAVRAPNAHNLLGMIICDVGYGETEEVNVSNARLIAAAPDLFKAANDAYSRLLSLGQYEGRYTMKGQAELASLVDAIATATGRAHQDVQDEFEAREVMRVPT